MPTYSEDMMDIRECIEFIRYNEKELRLFNVSQTNSLRADLEAYFETQNVRITESRTATGAPEDIAVLSNTAEVLGVLDVPTLRALLETVPRGPGDLGIADKEYEGILGPLKETTFTSYDSEQLLYVSREIEDRARRMGNGSIHAGFQQCSVMADQRRVYTDLARRGIDVHAYGVPDTEPPDFGPGHIHPIQTDEIAETWFVVFDGGGTDAQKSALLAQERDEDFFYGVWTYDPEFVDHVLDYLTQMCTPSIGDVNCEK
ncbi:DICT sensory domain-containing protein [Halovenus salina]|uniref:DICT sensory domain-containing protein n=1 Tax=Halovenus salina TaxID=1510225 RepID=A0ABD5W0C6_9EURY|nr:DICT sensory domain-containing protein [Halovenus salina]